MDRAGTNTLLVLTNLPNRDAAMKLAAAIVGERLAACVNVLGGCTSIYRWKGAVEESQEVPVLIKTNAQRYPDLEAAIRRLHPYEVPELIAMRVVDGLPEYLAWVAQETTAAT
jgi:periplasmic divalent cation tolerance protein